MPEPARGLPPVLSVLIGAAVALVLGILTFWPQAVGLGTLTGLVHLQSFRAVATAGVIIVAAVLSLSWVLRRGTRFCAGFIAVSLVFAGISLGVLAVRGSAPRGPVPAVTGDIRVVSANMLFAAGSLDDVLGADARRAQVIALQEADAGLLREALAQRGLADDYLIADRVAFGDRLGTVLAVHRDLGPKRIAAPEVSRAFVGMRTRVGDIYSIHTHAPIETRPTQQAWQRTVRTAAQLCGPQHGDGAERTDEAEDRSGSERSVGAGTGAIVAGDFNATLDHAPLQVPNGCEDAALSLGAAATGTWPASLPGMLGAQIDHQLVDTSVLTPLAIRIIDIADSDHRGLIIDYHLAPGKLS